MAQTERSPITPEAVEATTYLQRHCQEAYLTVAASLQAGMTERAISTAIKKELATRGISDFWYDIPVMVLFGERRFLDMTRPTYSQKEPGDTKLEEGAPFF